MNRPGPRSIKEGLVQESIRKRVWISGIKDHLWSSKDSAPQNNLDMVFNCRDGKIASHLLLLKCTSSIIGLSLQQNESEVATSDLVHILVPDVSVHVVAKSLQLIYTGCVKLESEKEMEQVMDFVCSHLGIDMMLNWNKSVADTTPTFIQGYSLSNPVSSFETSVGVNLNSSIDSSMSDGDIHMLGQNPDLLNATNSSTGTGPFPSTPKSINDSRNESSASMSSNVSINPEIKALKNSLMSLIRGSPLTQKPKSVTREDLIDGNDSYIDIKHTPLDDTDLEIVKEIPLPTFAKKSPSLSEQILASNEPSFFNDFPSSCDQSTPNPGPGLPRKGRKLLGPKSRVIQANSKNQIKEQFLQTKFGSEQLRYMSSKKINDLQKLTEQSNNSLQDTCDKEKNTKNPVTELLDLLETFSPRKNNNIEITADPNMTECVQKWNESVPDSSSKSTQENLEENDDIIVIIDDDQINPSERFDMPSENQEIEMEGSCLEDEAFNNNFAQNYKTKLKYRGSKQGPSYAEMIQIALKSLNEKEGSSRNSIANYILKSFDVNNRNDASVKTKMRQNLRRMVKKGELLQIGCGTKNPTFQLVN